MSNPFGQAATTDQRELEQSMLDTGFNPNYPIMLYEGDILDGWHRYQAAKRTRCEPVFQEFDGNETEARQFVYAANVARRHMSQRQKATAYLLMNQWVEPSEQLSAAEIVAKCGFSSRTLVSQLERIAESDPELAHQVAVGNVPAAEAIRTLGEDPAGSPDSNADGNPASVFTLKKRSLIAKAHEARLRVRMTRQAQLNKAFELFVDWAMRQEQPHLTD